MDGKNHLNERGSVVAVLVSAWLCSLVLKLALLLAATAMAMLWVNLAAAGYTSVRTKDEQP